MNKIIDFLKIPKVRWAVIAGVVLLVGGVLWYAGVSNNNAQQARQEQLRKDEEIKKEKERLAAEEQQKIADQQASSQTETATAPPPAIGCTRGETRYVTAAVGLTVRVEKNSASHALAVAPYGSAMKVGCLEGEWYHSEYNGQIGYSLAAYLSATAPAPAQQPHASATPAKNPTAANCLPNEGSFTVYASVPTGTPTYWGSLYTDPSGIIVPYGTAMSVHCYEGNINKLLYGQTDSFVKSSQVTTTKP